MSIPFSRSTRSLFVDSFRPAVIGLVLAVLTLLALIVWFFLARVTLFQSSTSASLEPGGQIIASFPAESFSQIKPGQSAVLRLGQSGDQRPLVIPAVVFDTQGGNEQVILVVTDYSSLPGTIAEEIQGRVDVETEYISPAELLLRASGKFLARGRIPTSPQATPEASSNAP
jgi:hypothetical protein